MIYKICVNQLFMLSVRLPGSCALLVKFWGSQKLYIYIYIFDFGKRGWCLRPLHYSGVRGTSSCNCSYFSTCHLSAPRGKVL